MGKNSEQWILLGFESIIYGECCKIHQWSTGNPISEQQHLTGTCLVAELCLTLCNPVNCSTPVFPVLHYLPEFAQTHIHWISDTIQPSHPVSRLLLLPSIFPSIRVFPMSQFFASGGQSIGALASASVLTMNIQDWFPLGLTGLISLQSKGLSRVFFNTTVRKHRFFSSQPVLWFNSYFHTWLLEKNIALTRWTFVSKVMSLLFNMLSRLVITFLPRSKCLVISRLQSPFAVILEPPKISM